MGWPSSSLFKDLYWLRQRPFQFGSNKTPEALVLESTGIEESDKKEVIAGEVKQELEEVIPASRRQSNYAYMNKGNHSEGRTKDCECNYSLVMMLYKGYSPTGTTMQELSWCTSSKIHFDYFRLRLFGSM